MLHADRAHQVALPCMNTVNLDDQGKGVQLRAWTHRKVFRIERPARFIYGCNSQDGSSVSAAIIVKCLRLQVRQSCCPLKMHVAWSKNTPPRFAQHTPRMLTRRIPRSSTCSPPQGAG